MSDFTDKSYKILEKLDDGSETQKQINKVKEKNSLQTLQEDILVFFQKHTKEISKKNALKEELENSLLDDVRSGSLDFDQKMRLYNASSKELNNSLENFFALFKPAPGTPSVLIDTVSKAKEEKDVSKEIFETTNSKDLQTLQKLDQILSRYEKENKKEE